MNPLYTKTFFDKQVQAAADVDDPAKRAAIQAETAQQAINDFTAQIAFEFNHFINFHLPLEAKNSPFEGNSVEASLSFWTTFIEAIQKNLSRYLPLNITPEQFQAVSAALKDLQTYRGIIFKERSSSEEANNIAAAKELQEHMVSSLKEKRPVYALHGFCDGPNHSGHAISSRSELDGQIVNKHQFNQGEGSSEHPILDFTESGEIRSYRYFPIEITLKKFQGEAGFYDCLKDVLLAKQIPRADVPGYDAMDCYGPSLIIGKVRPDRLSWDKSLHKKTQAGMTCSEKAVKLTVYDALVIKSTPHREIKRLFCLARLCSIVAAYQHWLIAQDREDLYKITCKFEKAISAFALAIENRTEIFLSKEEMTFCNNIIEMISAKIRPILDKKPHLTSTTLSTEQATACLTKFPAFEIAPLLPLPEDKETQVTKKITPILLPSTRITSYGELLKVQLEGFEASAKSLMENDQYPKLLHFIHRIFLRLDDPSPDCQDVWEHIPPAHRPAIATSIRNLLLCGLIARNTSYDCTLTMLAFLYKGYAIVDRLARSLPEAKLKGYYPQNWLNESQEMFTYINNGDNDRSLTKSISYLRKIQDNNNAPLFYFEGIIDIQEGVRALSNHFISHPSTPHLKYLQQFYENAWSNGLSRGHSKYSHQSYRDLWIDSECKYFPIEVHALRQISCLIRLAVNGDYDVARSNFREMSEAFLKSSKPSDPFFTPQDNHKISLLKLDRAIKEPPQFGIKDRKIEREENTKVNADLTQKVPANQNQGALNPDLLSSNIHLVRCERDLHLATALAWVKRDPMLFETPKSLYALQALLLHHEIIQEEVRRNPTIVFEFRRVFKDVINIHLKRPAVALKIIPLVIFAESHFKAFQGRSYDFSMGAHLKNVLANQPNWTNTQILNLLLYAILPPLDKDTVLPFLQAAFKHSTSLRVTEFDSCSLEARAELEAHLEELPPFFNDAMSAKNLCESIAKPYVQSEEQKQNEWKGTFPHYVLGDIELDFARCSVAVKNKAVEAREVTFYYNEHQPSVSKVVSKQGIWINQNIFETLDGNERVIRDDHWNVEYHRKFKFSGQWHWYRNISIDNGQKYMLHTPLKHYGLGPDEQSHIRISSRHIWWQCIDSKKGFDRILIQDTEDKKKAFSYCLIQSKTEFTVSKVDETGNVLPIQLINFEQWSKAYPDLYDSLNCHLDFSVVQVFFHTVHGHIESVHYPKLGLDFYRKEDDKGLFKLRSKQFPDFWLELGTRIDELGPYNHYIVLGSAHQKRMVYLIPLEFHSQREDKSSTGGMSRLPEMHFVVDETSGMLASNSPTANLYLAFLFAFQRNYEKALEYLLRSSKLTSYDYSDKLIIRSYEKFTDESPEALAFYLKFVIHLIDHTNQPIYQPRRTGMFDDIKRILNQTHFANWASKILYRYSQIVGFKATSRVPIQMRLDEIQLQILLNYLRVLKEQQDEDEETSEKFIWPTLNELRYQLLESPNRKFVFRFNEMQNYRIYPVEMDPNDWEKGLGIPDRSTSISHAENHSPVRPNYFVRFPREHIFEYFIFLYEKIMSANEESLDSVDVGLFYFARSISLESGDARSALKILHLARRNPEKFKDIRFDLTIQLTPLNHRDTLLLIHQRYSTMVIQEQAKIESTVKQFTTFTSIFHSSYELRLPSLPAKLYCQWEFSEALKKPIKDALSRSFIDSKSNKEKTVVISKDDVPFIPNVKTRPKTKLEENIWEQFSLGHKAALKEEAEISLPTLQLTLEQVEAKLNSLQEEENLAITTLKEQIELKANRRPSDKSGKVAAAVLMDDHRHRLRIAGKQASRIEVDTILLQALLQKDLSLIRQANPTLSGQEINELAASTALYYIRCCTRNRIKDALRLLNKIRGLKGKDAEQQRTELTKLLFWKGDYDPFEQPEVLIYCYHTKRTLRQNQMNLLKEIFKQALGSADVSHLLFAFEAGGGKTDLIKVILKAIVRRQGYTAVTVSPKSSYEGDAEKERRALMDAFDQRAVPLEVGLHTNLTHNELIHIRSYLEKCGREKLHPMHTPETKYALFLKYIVALYEKDVEAVRHLSIINFRLFKEKFFGFFDESRLTLGPLTHAMIGLGKPIPLPITEQALYIRIYRQIFCIDKDPLKIGNRLIVDVLNLLTDHQGETSQEDVDEIKRLVAKRFVNDSDLNIPSEHHEAVIEYWLTPSCPKPEWILQLKTNNIEAYKLNTVVREFFYRIFPFAISQAHKRDYGRTVVKNVEFDVPKERKGTTDAYYKNPYETLAISIQGTFQRGLSELQVRNLLERIVATYKSELRSGTSPQDCPTFKLWSSWAGGKLPPLESIFENIDHQAYKLCPVLSRDGNAIFKYLEEVILSQVVYSPQSVSVDVCHLFEAFARVICTSAYPGLVDLYPFRPTKDAALPCIDSKIFPAKVLQELCDPRNSKMIDIEFDTIEQFFEQVFAKDPDIFHELCMIGDAYGMLRKFDNLDVAKAFLIFVRKQKLIDKQFPHFDGVLLFKEEVVNGANGGHYLYLSDPNEGPVALEGGDVKEALQVQLGLRWEDLKLVNYYNVNNNVGEHMPHPEKGKILFLLAEKTPISFAIQTLLRNRNFFLKTTSVVSCTRTSLKVKIQQEIGAIASPPGNIAWMVANEAELSAQEILVRGYRQIAFLILKSTIEELQQALDDPQKQIKIFHANPQRFIEIENEEERYEQFAQSVTMGDTGKVLRKYAKGLYKKYYGKSLSKGSQLYQEISIIIARIKDKIDKIPSRNISQSGERTRIHIHQVQKMEEKQKHQVAYNLNPIDEKPLADNLHIFSDDLTNALKKLSQPVQALFGSPSLSKDLYYTQGAVNTAYTGYTSLGKGFLKPIDDILIIQLGNGPLIGFALSKMEAAHFKRQFDQGLAWLDQHGQRRPKNTVPHRVMLVTSTAILSRNGSESSAFPWPEVVKESAYQDILIDVALLQGRICFPDRLCERLKTWHDIWSLWGKIVASAARPNEIQKGVVEGYFPRHIQAPALPQQPAATSSWLNWIKGSS